MDVKKRRNRGLALALGLPLLLLLLFFLLRGQRDFMNFWVFSLLEPTVQFLGRLCSHVPFSVFEWGIVTGILVTAGFLICFLVDLYRKRLWRPFLRRILKLAAPWLWLMAAFYWMWNTTYYADSFSQRSGLAAAPYTTRELALVTDYFAANAAKLSTQVERDGELHWNEELDAIVERAPAIYDRLSRQFPCLEMESIPAKPFFFSPVQSVFGFTGMYSPFTGEAQFNDAAPAAMIPCTIGHEMSHQRMVASELEANFLGVAACTTCDDAVFQYSGWLTGLTHLSRALVSASPEAWYSITGSRFTPELKTDWDDSINYWKSFQSPVQEVSDQAYDAFLRHNDQQLGIRSYGACVDLLVAYYLPQITMMYQPRT